MCRNVCKNVCKYWCTYKHITVDIIIYVFSLCRVGGCRAGYDTNYVCKIRLRHSTAPGKSPGIQKSLSKTEAIGFAQFSGLGLLGWSLGVLFMGLGFRV